MFTLYFGRLPFLERDKGPKSLKHLFKTNKKEFLEFHNGKSNKIRTRQSMNDFMELFEGMINIDPEERFTIEEIKNSAWYKKKVYER